MSERVGQRANGMGWSLRRFQVVTAVVVASVWIVLWAVGILLFDQPPNPVFVVYSTAAWVGAALLVLNRWWSRAGAGLATLDAPERLLAVAVNAIPERRRAWGMAMLAELAEVRGRSDRWRFALSSVRALLWLPPVGGWPLLVLVAGLAGAAAVAAVPVVGGLMPELNVFAASFAGIFGVLVLATLAHATRPRLANLPPALLVMGTVAAAVWMTVIFLRRDPSAAVFLSPSSAVFLAAVLAGCLWMAVAAPQSARVNRAGPYLGAGVALGYVAAFLLLTRIAYDPRVPEGLREVSGLVAAIGLVFGPAVVLFAASLLAASYSGSFRLGLRAGLWASVVSMPLAYSLWLYESLRMYAIDGGLLIFGDNAPEAENLSVALTFCLLFVLVFGLPFAVFGSALGTLRRQHTRTE